MRNAERGMNRRRVVPDQSASRTPRSKLESRFRPGFSQAGDTIAVLPLAPFLEQGDPFKTLEDIAFGADGADGAETRML